MTTKETEAQVEEFASSHTHQTYCDERSMRDNCVCGLERDIDWLRTALATAEQRGREMENRKFHRELIMAKMVDEEDEIPEVSDDHSFFIGMIFLAERLKKALTINN